MYYQYVLNTVTVSVKRILYNEKMNEIMYHVGQEITNSGFRLFLAKKKSMLDQYQPLPCTFKLILSRCSCMHITL